MWRFREGAGSCVAMRAGFRRGIGTWVVIVSTSLCPVLPGARDGTSARSIPVIERLGEVARA